MLDQIIGKLATVKEAPGDYTEDDGLLYCGKCHTPKTALLKLPDLTGSDTPRLFPIACRCREEAAEAAAAKQRAEEFRLNLESRWQLEGFHDPSYLEPKFSADDGANPKLTAVCKKYADRWPEMLKNGIGLLLYGGVGGGKTFLSGCICNTILQ